MILLSDAADSAAETSLKS